MAPMDSALALAEAAKGAGIKPLVLFGSRARGEVHAHSDWDFGYVGEDRCDVEHLLDRFMQILATDRIDLVDLAKLAETTVEKK
jgi:predicted nucleotidyltransferase